MTPRELAYTLIDAAVRSAGLTFTQAAAQAEMSYRALAYIRQGKRSPDAAIRVLEAIGCDVKQFIEVSKP